MIVKTNSEKYIHLVISASDYHNNKYSTLRCSCNINQLNLLAAEFKFNNQFCISSNKCSFHKLTYMYMYQKIFINLEVNTLSVLCDFTEWSRVQQLFTSMNHSASYPTTQKAQPDAVWVSCFKSRTPLSLYNYASEDICYMIASTAIQCIFLQPSFRGAWLQNYTTEPV